MDNDGAPPFQEHYKNRSMGVVRFEKTANDFRDRKPKPDDWLMIDLLSVSLNFSIDSNGSLFRRTLTFFMFSMQTERQKSKQASWL